MPEPVRNFCEVISRCFELLIVELQTVNQRDHYGFVRHQRWDKYRRGLLEWHTLGEAIVLEPEREVIGLLIQLSQFAMCF